MNTTNKFLIALYIDENKDNIIQKYDEDMPITAIAELYGVSKSIIYLRLVKWGIKIKKTSQARRWKPKNQYKRKFSPELQAAMKENSRINDRKIQYIKFVNSTEDQRLIDNILSRPIIG